MPQSKSKCPKCAWTGTWPQFMKHYASKHHTNKNIKKTKARKKWPSPPFARKK